MVLIYTVLTPLYPHGIQFTMRREHEDYEGSKDVYARWMSPL